MKTRDAYPPEEKIRKPEGATLFLVVSYNSEEVYYDCKKILQNVYSPVMYESNLMPRWILPVNERSLYLTGQSTRILSFKQRIHRDELPPIYREALNVRKKFAKKDPSLRMYPGYLTRFNTILASTVDDFHKIYLYHGIFGEIIYRYIGSRLSVTETAPEFFHSKETMYFFTHLRESHEYYLKKYR